MDWTLRHHGDAPYGSFDPGVPPLMREIEALPEKTPRVEDRIIQMLMDGKVLEFEVGVDFEEGERVRFQTRIGGQASRRRYACRTRTTEHGLAVQWEKKPEHWKKGNK